MCLNLLEVSRDRGLHALRVQELAALKETDEKQYLRMVAELSQHGLDRPAQALAVVVGNEALTDLLVSAQMQGRAKLRENATDEEQAAVTDAVAAALDRIADENGIDTRGFGFAVEDLAFQFFNLTGDAETAAKDAAALFAKQLQTLAPQGGASSEEQEGSFPEILFLAAKRKKGKSQKKGRKNSEDDTDNETMSEEEKLNRITEIADQRTTTESDLSEIAELLVSLVPVVGSTISGVEAIIATKIAIKAFEDVSFRVKLKERREAVSTREELSEYADFLARGYRQGLFLRNNQYRNTLEELPAWFVDWRNL